MAKLYNHGHKVADFSKEGFSTYRLMSDGKWMKSKARGWKMAKWKEGAKPITTLIGQEFKVETFDSALLDEALKAEVKP